MYSYMCVRIYSYMCGCIHIYVYSCTRALDSVFDLATNICNTCLRMHTYINVHTYT